MKVGCTGTRSGMSEAQRLKFTELLEQLRASQLHHGDCVGADAHAHAIASDMGIEVILHPPTNPRHRAFCKGSIEERDQKGYLERNKDIVDETEILIATPWGPEQKRSGTWSTVRYARKQGRAIHIVMRDGVVVVEG